MTDAGHWMGSVDFASKPLERLEGTRRTRHERLPRKRRYVELLGRPALARGSLKGIGKAGFKRR